MKSYRIPLDKVEYLALEGGGGKGNAYIGAIKALENLGFLPANANPLEVRTRKIKGFSGSSAGAITSFFLSIGYTAREIAKISALTNYDNFFDDPIWNKRVSPNMLARPHDYISDLEETYDSSYKSTLSLTKDVLEALLFVPVVPVPSFIPKGVREILAAFPTKEASEYVDEGIQILAKIILNLRKEKIKQDSKVLYKRLYGMEGLDKKDLSDKKKYQYNNLDNTLKSLMGSLGIFPGLEIRWFLQKWLILAVLKQLKGPHWFTPKPNSTKHIEDFHRDWINKREPKDNPGDDFFRKFGKQSHPQAQEYMEAAMNMTFAKHCKKFKNELIIAGSNLSTFNSNVFSRITSPNFLVIDAVRISMSIPFLFKPMIITEEDIQENKLLPQDEKLYSKRIAAGGRLEPHWLKGVWVDGGVFNNIPLHVFDSNPSKVGHTLGLRLADAHEESIESFADFCMRYFKLLSGTGESHISVSERNIDRAIILDTEIYPPFLKPNGEKKKISLFMFNVEDDLLIEINYQSFERVMKYFNKVPKRKDFESLKELF